MPRDLRVINVLSNNCFKLIDSVADGVADRLKYFKSIILSYSLSSNFAYNFITIIEEEEKK